MAYQGGEYAVLHFAMEYSVVVLAKEEEYIFGTCL